MKLYNQAAKINSESVSEIRSEMGSFLVKEECLTKR